MLALGAVGAGEAVSKDAALEIAAEGSLDMGRRCFTVLAAGELQPGFEVGLDDAIPQRLPGTAAPTLGERTALLKLYRARPLIDSR